MVPSLPTGTDSARPFLPALDFATSKAFYEALGFTNELDDDDVAIYRVGSDVVPAPEPVSEGLGGELHDATRGR